MSRDTVHRCLGTSFTFWAGRASRISGTPLFLGRELIRLAAARRRLGASDHEIAPLVREALEIAEKAGATVIHTDAAHYDLRGDTPKPGSPVR
jgi:hypothetical protein